MITMKARGREGGIKRKKNKMEKKKNGESKRRLQG